VGKSVVHRRHKSFTGQCSTPQAVAWRSGFTGKYLFLLILPLMVFFSPKPVRGLSHGLRALSATAHAQTYPQLVWIKPLSQSEHGLTRFSSAIVEL
jgi:hypothetical protein